MFINDINSFYPIVSQPANVVNNFNFLFIPDLGKSVLFVMDTVTYSQIFLPSPDCFT